MKLLTDSPEFANAFFNKNILFQELNNNSPYQIFFDKAFYIAYDFQYPPNQYFETIIINKFSHSSQFDILNTEHQINENILCFSDGGNDFHGFKNRNWETLPGNFHLSFKISPDIHFPLIYQAFIILAANVTVASIEEMTSLNPNIKWVNDIMIDDSKIAGFITKTRTQNNRISEAIIGVGVNIVKSPDLIPDKFVKKATHLNKFGYDYSSADFLNVFLNKFNELYDFLKKSNYKKLFDMYYSKSVILNKNISIYDENSPYQLLANGIVEEINQDLTIKFKENKQIISRGRISMDFFVNNFKIQS